MRSIFAASAAACGVMPQAQNTGINFFLHLGKLVIQPDCERCISTRMEKVQSQFCLSFGGVISETLPQSLKLNEQKNQAFYEALSR
jgi:hypothetical protein